jgi:arsenite methyltransferase
LIAFLEPLPNIYSKTVDSFTGVSRLSILANIPKGSTVLDIGCGAGMDSFIAEMESGSSGKVIGVDFSQAMINKAKESAKLLGSNVSFYCASAENLPVDDASIDIVLINGIFNLNPNREAIFLEVARVTKANGVAYTAELILNQPQPTQKSDSLDDWFS